MWNILIVPDWQKLKQAKQKCEMTYFQDIFEIKTVNLVKNNNLLQIPYSKPQRDSCRKKKILYEVAYIFSSVYIILGDGEKNLK